MRHLEYRQRCLRRLCRSHCLSSNQQQPKVQHRHQHHFRPRYIHLQPQSPPRSPFSHPSRQHQKGDIERCIHTLRIPLCLPCHNPHLKHNNSHSTGHGPTPGRLRRKSKHYLDHLPSNTSRASRPTHQRRGRRRLDRYTIRCNLRRRRLHPSRSYHQKPLLEMAVTRGGHPSRH